MARGLAPRAGGILSYFTRHPTAANLLLVVLVVLGLAAAPRMQAQFFPDVIVDNVSVSVVWTGASAEDVGSRLCQGRGGTRGVQVARPGRKRGLRPDKCPNAPRRCWQRPDTAHAARSSSGLSKVG